MMIMQYRRKNNQDDEIKKMKKGELYYKKNQ